ncbi:RNA-binding S4 domain-containing protein [Magnetospira sp. QH-2]|uniref:RNA-binding S4 domain-containing protein n=1 Tax=Magnetospira sp. (strain QH-2) TaxID=1288970 RepID=UPI0003E8118C|nr:RNA-binding S4 domain-containing protein [Magnetospira sp. QH-2]CCQ75535.1 ribosome-associated heat shock protein Hsp15 [Magnetospira sp. QH-2]
MSDGGPSLRVDKWLWQARFFKSRTLAGKFVQTGKLHMDGETVTKAHHLVRPGDVLTFPQGPHMRVIQILALGTRRGPAPEARTLYEDLAPPQPKAKPGDNPDLPAPVALRERGSGRPTKTQRRALDKLREWD